MAIDQCPHSQVYQEKEIHLLCAEVLQLINVVDLTTLWIASSSSNSLLRDMNVHSAGENDDDDNNNNNDKKSKYSIIKALIGIVQHIVKL